MLPLNGSLPHSAAYKMTPSDQTSTEGPRYLTPVMISGAAYLGEPQKVSRTCSLSYRFDRPKSMILTCFRSSSRMFSIPVGTAEAEAHAPRSRVRSRRP